MRNKYPSTCWKCSKPVKPDEGYIERFKGDWRVQHIGCKEREAEFRSFGEAVKETNQTQA